MISYDTGVTLGPLDSNYNELVRSWRNNPEIYKWCRQSDLITDTNQLRWYESQAKDSSIKMYLIWNYDDVPVGVCGFTSIDVVNRRAEFSLYICPDKQKKGFGEKSLSTLFRHGFENLNLNCIWGETFDGNPAAKMFERIGMVKEGTRRQFYFKNGNYIDCHVYSILRSELK